MGKKKKKKVCGYVMGPAYNFNKKKKKEQIPLRDRPYHESEVLPQKIKDQIADSLERFMDLKNYCIIIDNASRSEHQEACQMVYHLINCLRDGSPEAEAEVLDKGACQRYLEELEEFEDGGMVEDY